MKTDRNPFFIEAGYFQKPSFGQHAYGDVILKKFIKEENRRLIALSDGMGSGIKANVLASLTASMVLNFVYEHKSVQEAFSLIFNILPECSVRKLRYATFTIIDVNSNNRVNLLNYDNPAPFLIRGQKLVELKWKVLELSHTPYAGNFVASADYTPEAGDRLIAFSDGISQSGLGRTREWKREGAINYLLRAVGDSPVISAMDLSEKLVNKAEQNDASGLKDDASAVTLYFRAPRRLVIATGAPGSREKDFAFARHFREFDGVKVVAGGTTSEIIARELDLKFSDSMTSLGDGLPPISQLESVDLVTEGVMTLSRVERLLRIDDTSVRTRDGAAERMLKLIQNADEIEIMLGTASNEHHFDFEYKMRIQLVKDMAEVIETRHLKTATIRYF